MTMTTSPTLPGKFVWIEHVSKEPHKAQAFYGEVIGWKIEGAPMGDFTYEMIKADDHTIGYTLSDVPNPKGAYTSLKKGADALAGLMKTPVPQLPSHWIQYFVVDDTDAAAARATRAGGQLKLPPMSVPDVGRFAIAT